MNKSELCGIGVKKGIDLAFCGCKVVNLDKETVKILRAHFSYNMSLVDSRNFVETISKMEEILSVWSHRALTLIGRISVFKILALSKILYISSMKTVPKFITEKLDKLQKSFVWKSKKPKIKHSTLIRDYSEGGLKEVDIKSKIVALQLTWIRRLHDGNFHPWKLIPLNVLKPPGGSAVFHQNLDLNAKLPNALLSFYRNLLSHWCENFSHYLDSKGEISSEYIWYNKYIRIAGKPVSFRALEERGIKHISDIFFENGSHIPWSTLKDLQSVPSTQYFTWMQVLDAIPDNWKILLKGNGEYTTNDLNSSTSYYKVWINNRLSDVNKLTSKEINLQTSCSKSSTQLTAQKTITTKLQAIHGKEYVIDWPGVYIVAKESYNGFGIKKF